jgi:hypothetical protein
MDIKFIAKQILEQLDKHSVAIFIIFSIFGGIWAIIKFNEGLKDRRFKTYHDLIKKLVEPSEPSKDMMLDRQVAIIYELRNFPKYYPVTIRIFKGLKNFWEKEEKNGRLTEELSLSINYMESNSLKRFFKNTFQKL